MKAKLIIIGDSGVGKTSLLCCALGETFQQYREKTIGVEFGAKIINIGQQSLKLYIWDAAGQETNKSMARSCYTGCNCAVLVYDVTRRESFENITSWLKEAQYYTTNEDNTRSLVLVANKIDQEDKRLIQIEDGERFAINNHLLYIEASVKTGFQVEKVSRYANQIFQISAETILQNMAEKQAQKVIYFYFQVSLKYVDIITTKEKE